jgi:arylsulfatase A-like enzyme
VPGLIEWPARIREPKVSSLRASTSDLLPTLCHLVDKPLPSRPIDGINLMPLIDGNQSKRDNPLCFWMFGATRGSKTPPKPWIAPELQVGTTPMVKLMGGKATRDFTNFHHSTVTEQDYRGPRAIIQDDFKLVIHDRGQSDGRVELFNLADDPAEKMNLANQNPELVESMQSALRQWQTSVLQSLSGADYHSSSSPAVAP